MKQPTTLFLLLLCNFLSAQVTLSTQQAKEVYKGLKQGEILKERLKAIDSLNNIILDQDYNLNYLTDQVRAYNTTLDSLYTERQRAAVDYEKSKPTPWYKHWLTWGVIGFVSGVLIGK